MLYINNRYTNPYFNLALEEYLMKNFHEDFFMLWMDAPCVVIGKNQNAFSEVNIAYIEKNNIPVIRRLSGGGAVYHDFGNINFTFISNEYEEINNFEKFTKPIMEILSELGIRCELSGRNDLTIDGKKFSGNAQYIHRQRILHHGTLLFSSSSEQMSKALKGKPSKFQDKSVKSVAARVTNIHSYLKENLKLDDFRDKLLEKVIVSNHAEEYILTDEDMKNIHNLVEEKYATWDWNFGKSPRYNFKKETKYPAGLMEVYLFVEKGIIKEIKINGDFFHIQDICHLEKMLTGVRHDKKEILKELSTINMEDYLLNITRNQLVEAMF